jgi:hypothetical protein
MTKEEKKQEDEDVDFFIYQLIVLKTRIVAYQS